MWNVEGEGTFDFHLLFASLNKLHVLAQAQLAILFAHALGGFEAQHAAQSPLLHNLGLHEQTTRNRIRRFEAIEECGHATANHVVAREIHRGAQHVVVEPIFDTPPPELIQKRPEVGGRIVCGNAMRQHAIAMPMRVHKAGRDGAVAQVDHCRIGVMFDHVGRIAHRDNAVVLDQHGLVAFGRFGWGCYEPRRKQKLLLLLSHCVCIVGTCRSVTGK